MFMKYIYECRSSRIFDNAGNFTCMGEPSGIRLRIDQLFVKRNFEHSTVSWNKLNADVGKGRT